MNNSKLSQYEEDTLRASLVREDAYLCSHMPYLTVESREYTGHGLYVNIRDDYPGCVNEENNYMTNNLIWTIISDNVYVMMAVFLTGGRISFLEFATCGDDEFPETEIIDYKIEPIKEKSTR